MDLGLKNRIAVVLAGSSGIGLGVARALAQEGCDLVICGRDRARLAAAREQITAESGSSVLSIQADVIDAASLDAFFETVFSHHKKVDILVNNSGGPPSGPIESLTDIDYLNAFNLVFMSKVRASRYVLPSMKKQGWGRIINIESTSIKCALENMVLSNAFRSAAAAYAKTLAIESERDGIRVHTLMSGPFMTRRVDELGKAAAVRQGISLEQWRSEAEENTPLGRFGDPLEYGELVAFLASTKSDYMSGTCIAIDGGALKTIS